MVPSESPLILSGLFRQQLDIPNKILIKAFLFKTLPGQTVPGRFYQMGIMFNPLIFYHYNSDMPLPGIGQLIFFILTPLHISDMKSM